MIGFTKSSAAVCITKLHNTVVDMLAIYHFNCPPGSFYKSVLYSLKYITILPYPIRMDPVPEGGAVHKVEITLFSSLLTCVTEIYNWRD